MNDTLSIVLTASAWAAGGGLAVWLVTMPLRRRSIVALLASIVLAGTVASVAAVIGSVHAMFLTTNRWSCGHSGDRRRPGRRDRGRSRGRRLTKDNRARARLSWRSGSAAYPMTTAPS